MKGFALKAKKATIFRKAFPENMTYNYLQEKKDFLLHLNFEFVYDWSINLCLINEVLSYE